MASFLIRFSNFRLHFGRQLIRTSPFSSLNSPKSSIPSIRSPVIVPIRTKKHKAEKGHKKPEKGHKKASLDDFIDEIVDEEDEDEKPKNEEKTKASKFISEVYLKLAHKAKTKGKKAASVSYEEAMTVINLENYWTELEKIKNELSNHYSRHLRSTGSANNLDNLPIELEGDSFPLNEIAKISKKDSKRLIIDCSAFPAAASSILGAIKKSGMNLNPMQEGSGTTIVVPVPKMTKEYRERLSKGAKDKFMEAKESYRKVQNRYVSKMKNRALSEDSHFPKDQLHSIETIILAMADHFGRESEDLMHHKQKELMGGEGK